jgi:replicative DNA helicase
MSLALIIAVPTYAVVNAASGSKLVEPEELGDDAGEWLMDEFETFIRHMALERAIIKASDMLESGEYGAVEALVKEAVQISIQKNLGTSYYEDPIKRLQGLKNTNGQMSTGWAGLDKRLYGGLNRGELHIFAAPSGGGKSLFLANLALNYSLNHHDVVYVTFELSEELVCMRIDAMTTGIPAKDIFRRIDDVESKVKTMGSNAGAIQVKYLPSGKTCNDLRAYLKEYKVKTGVMPSVVAVDYLDLMMPVSKKVSPENTFIKDKFVSEELRNLAKELNCLVITASQLNRQAQEESEYNHSHISGGLSKIQTADGVYGIYRTPAMIEQGKYELQFLKTRNNNACGSKLQLCFDQDTLRITDAEEPVTVSLPISQVANINRNKPAPVSAEVESTTLRRLLNQFGNTDLE